MGSHKNLIEINGKTYEINKGGTATISPGFGSGQVMDGFFKKPLAVAPKIIHPEASTKTNAAKTVHKTRSNINGHLKHHKPERSKTLVRGALKKPAPITNKKDSTSINTSQLGVSQSRLTRAKKFHKSALVSRFPSFTHHSSFVKKTEALAVKPAPVHHTAVHKTPAHHNKSSHIRSQVAHQAVVAASQSEQLFNQALANAPARETYRPTHKKKKPSKSRVAHHVKRSKKGLQIAAGIAAVIILAGFITYQNLPNLNLRLASAKAGFSAQMPGYKPAGFAVSGPIEYSPGKVTINFKSNTDSRNFHVTQRVSSWNSESLLENFIVAGNKTYQTLEEKGKTIFTYDGSNATWVNGGVWYQIEGESKLNNDQLTRIANSL